MGVMSTLDLVLIGGFKGAAHPKIEAVRAATNQPLMAPQNPTIKAVASDTPLSRQLFRGWLAHMAARQLARTTIARRVSSLRSFYRFCGQNQLLDVPDLGWLHAPQPPRTNALEDEDEITAKNLD